MKRIKVYQIRDIANCEYSFMGYKYAEGKLNMKDYKLVANFNNDANFTLDDVFKMGNNGILQKAGFKMRSISVSDIIEVNGKKYYVDSFGFKEVE